MNGSESNYRPYVILGMLMTSALILVFAIYSALQHDRMVAYATTLEDEAIERGAATYIEDCADCHGEQGEGVRGTAPALNTREFLAEASDHSLFSAIADGRPGTSMPAWGQAQGGPHNTQVIDDMVALIRSWEESAPSLDEIVLQGDAQRGAIVFSTTCYVCHGISGEGTEKGLRLNDPVHLAKYTDDYYREVIAKGRSDKGMPTWGSVLSEAEIEDLVAYIRTWDDVAVSAQVTGNVANGARIYAAGCATCHGVSGEGVDGLGASLRPNTFVASNGRAALSSVILTGAEHGRMPAQFGLLSQEEVTDLIALLESWQPAQVTAMDPAMALVQARYLELCAECHGESAEGGDGPQLTGNEFVQTSDDETIMELIARGNTKTGMPSFRRKMSEEEMRELIELLRTWQ